MLGLLVAGCSSSTALQTSESDDLYYASSDKTVRPEPIATAPAATYSNNGIYPASTYTETGSAPASGDATNPEYYDPELAKQPSVINNNYYYDNSGYYSSRGRRSYIYYNDPFYSPFGYSAAYCYGIYDPFCFPGYYPYSGLTVSFNFGYGYGSPYGYGYGYGYRPYGYYGYSPYNYGYGYGYGGGYGGYYHGFYDGYYAGGGSYGYGYNRSRVNYGPRGDRSVIPTNGSHGGRMAAPGRTSTIDPGAGGRINVDPGRVGRTTTPAMTGGQPGRVTTPQPGTAQPGRIATQPNQPGRPVRNAEPVQPQNYQFQDRPAMEQPGRPVRGDVGAPSRDITPSDNRPQEMRPGNQQDYAQPQIIREQPQQQQRPANDSYSRPQRESRQQQTPSYNYSQPSNHQNYSAPSRGFGGGGGGGGSMPGRSSGGGRPRN